MRILSILPVLMFGKKCKPRSFMIKISVRIFGTVKIGKPYQVHQIH